MQKRSLLCIWVSVGLPAASAESAILKSEDVELIEIVRGAASSRYEACAIGVAIDDEKLKGVVRVSRAMAR